MLPPLSLFPFIHSTPVIIWEIRKSYSLRRTWFHPVKRRPLLPSQPEVSPPVAPASRAAPKSLRDAAAQGLFTLKVVGLTWKWSEFQRRWRGNDNPTLLSRVEIAMFQSRSHIILPQVNSAQLEIRLILPVTLALEVISVAMFKIPFSKRFG